MGLIPGSGRSPGVENGNPLQDFCLENSMDRGPWQGLWGLRELDMTEHAWVYKTAKSVKMRWVRDGGPRTAAQTPLPFSWSWLCPISAQLIAMIAPFTYPCFRIFMVCQWPPHLPFFLDPMCLWRPLSLLPALFPRVLHKTIKISTRPLWRKLKICIKEQ